jgi:TatD DNase family protein
MMLVDSHVNLHAEAFAGDRAEIIARARAAGVRTLLTICDRIENFPAVLAIAESDEQIWGSVGAHPHHAKDHLELTVEDLMMRAAHGKIIAIGETGLDQHYGHSTLVDQEKVLRVHIAAARRLDLPLIVHTRQADDETARVLESEYEKGSFRILMHCFTSGEGLARRALALGAYFSLSGILTFKTADDVRRVAADLPLERVLLETDCPYLAPYPHRGRRNEPALLRDVHRYFCVWKGLDEKEVAEVMAENFFRLFSKARRPS